MPAGARCVGRGAVGVAFLKAGHPRTGIKRKIPHAPGTWWGRVAQKN
jgi:hypothetical protein